ncbi:hypothetical protein ACIQOU_35925 [Streptomyces sp. NPDC091279]|uniref:hypothetical protein n=1 Tax=unclassified Streptomyces TaxID=2593676 RepID=UPI003814FD63
MAVDPSDPATFEEDDAPRVPEIDVEAPADDTAEQRTDVTQEHDDPVAGADQDTANEADVVEQSRVVALDEDDYR